MATYTRAHLAERIEDAIQHNEEGKDGENGLQRSADYEARSDHRTKPRVMVCLRPIRSMRNPPMMVPGRRKQLSTVP